MSSGARVISGVSGGGHDYHNPSNISNISGSGGSHGNTVFLGVTEPISLTMPSPLDLKRTEELLRVLKAFNLYESEDGLKKRQSVLRELSQLVKEWIYEVGVEQGLDDVEARRAGGMIFTFGSYRLGVVTPGTDIDTLCVAPRHVSREAFFSSFVAKLRQEPKVTELSPIADAYTPIIKMVYDGVDIDLLFARLAMPSIPPTLQSLEDDNLLKNVDEKTARCLNGCRVADMILRLVPNIQNFRSVLRFIKLWAKNRGVYSNVLGYLGGVAWALLASRCCQLYPNFSPSQLINRFFRIFEKWNWRNPVLITKVREAQNLPGLMSLKVWNPKVNSHDRNHLMPIITPAFPSMNSTHNVTLTTRRVMQEEFQRGFLMTNKVESGEMTWADVLSPLQIFDSANHFLELQTLATNEAVLKLWHGWVESKLRFLFRSLERMEDLKIRPWPKVFSFHDDDWKFANAIFIALHFCRPKEKDPVNVGKFLTEKSKYEGQIGLRVKARRRSDLPEYVSPHDKENNSRSKKTIKMKAPSLQASLSTPQASSSPSQTPASAVSLVSRTTHYPTSRVQATNDPASSATSASSNKQSSHNPNHRGMELIGNAKEVERDRKRPHAQQDVTLSAAATPTNKSPSLTRTTQASLQVGEEQAKCQPPLMPVPVSSQEQNHHLLHQQQRTHPHQTQQKRVSSFAQTSSIPIKVHRRQHHQRPPS